MTSLTVHLRPVRLQKGWTQEELARRSGVAKSTISRIESGLTRGVGLGIVERLADALGLNPRTLLASPEP
jgi:transcriptional regulator with XRE-family HTH domain